MKIHMQVHKSMWRGKKVTLLHAINDICGKCNELYCLYTHTERTVLILGTFNEICRCVSMLVNTKYRKTINRFQALRAFRLSSLKAILIFIGAKNLRAKIVSELSQTHYVQHIISESKWAKKKKKKKKKKNHGVRKPLYTHLYIHMCNI